MFNTFPGLDRFPVISGKKGSIIVGHTKKVVVETYELKQRESLYRGIRGKVALMPKNNAPLFLGTKMVSSIYANPGIIEYKTTRNLTLLAVNGFNMRKIVQFIKNEIANPFAIRVGNDKYMISHEDAAFVLNNFLRKCKSDQVSSELNRAGIDSSFTLPKSIAAIPYASLAAAAVVCVLGFDGWYVPFKYHRVVNGSCHPSPFHNEVLICEPLTALTTSRTTTKQAEGLVRMPVSA